LFVIYGFLHETDFKMLNVDKLCQDPRTKAIYYDVLLINSLPLPSLYYQILL